MDTDGLVLSVELFADDVHFTAVDRITQCRDVVANPLTLLHQCNVLFKYIQFEVQVFLAHYFHQFFPWGHVHPVVHVDGSDETRHGCKNVYVVNDVVRGEV